MPKYCSKCGSKLEENSNFCSTCGNTVVSDNLANVSQSKSKIAAGILGILLGSLGIHNFYLGYNNKGIAQLLLTLVGWIACGLGPIIAGVWGLVDGILILIGSVGCDANGNPLSD